MNLDLEIDLEPRIWLGSLTLERYVDFKKRRDEMTR